MALRTIRVVGDHILEKECKPLKKVSERTRELIMDMFETMYDANGVGLAAPQVGVLRKLFVVDIGDGKRYVCINPTVTAIGDETQTGDEGCLSVPGKQGVVTRAMKVHVDAYDLDMKPYSFDAEGLLARAMAHENDHLSGILYTSKVEGELEDVNYESLEEEDLEDFE